MSPFHSSFRQSERRRTDKPVGSFSCLCAACRRLSSTLFRCLQDVILAQEVLQPLVLMVEVPVLHNLLELLQHRLALPTHARLEAEEAPNPRLTRLFGPHLLLHVRHLHGGFVPQLVGQTQLHLHAFVHQVPQGGHGLTGPLCEQQTLTPLSPSPGPWNGPLRTLHLGVAEAARPLGVDVVLQDALADVVYGFGQAGFPAGSHHINGRKANQRVELKFVFSGLL